MWSASSQLVVTVSDLKGTPIEGLILTTAGMSSTSKPTEQKTGRTRIVLGPNTKSGDWVQLVIFERPTSKGRFSMISPYDGWVTVPPFEESSTHFIHVYVIPKNQKQALESNELMVTIMRDVLNSTAPGKDSSEPRNFVTALTVVSRRYGLDPKEVEKAIQAWGAKPNKDSFEQGLFALYSDDLNKSTSLLTDSLQENERNMEEKKLEYEQSIIKYLENALYLGDSLMRQRKYSEAIPLYAKAAEIRNNDPWILHLYGLALRFSGRPDAAIGPHKQALDLLTPRLPAANWLTMYARDDLTLDYTSTKDYSAAISLREVQLHEIEDLIHQKDKAISASGKLPATVPGLSLYGVTTWQEMGRKVAIEPPSDNKKEKEPDEQDSVAGWRAFLVLKYIGDWRELALLYSSHDRNAEADALVERGRHLFQADKLFDGYDDWGTVTAALVAKNEGKTNQAKELFKEAIAADQANDDDPGWTTFDASDELVKLYASEKQYDEADMIASECIRKINDRHLRVPLIKIKALIIDIDGAYHDNGMEKQEEAFFRQLKVLADRDNDDEDLGMYEATAAHFFESAERFNDVIVTLRPTYERKVGHTGELGTSFLSSLGFAYAMVDQYDEAEIVLKEAVSRPTDQNGNHDPYDLERAWTGLALVYSHRGQCGPTTDAASKAADFAFQTKVGKDDIKSIKDIPVQCEAHSLLVAGLARRDEGKTELAKTIFEQAIAEDQSADDDPGHVTFQASDELVKIYSSEQRYDEAHRVAFDCVQTINDKKMEIHLLEIRDLINDISPIYKIKGMNGDGELFLGQLRVLANRTGSQYDEGFYAAVATDFFESLQRYSDVIATLRPRFDYVNQRKIEPDGFLFCHLGFAYAMVGNYDEAESILKSAIASQNAKNDETRPTLYRSWTGLALAYFRQGKCSAGKDALAKADEFATTSNFEAERETIRQLSSGCRNP